MMTQEEYIKKENDWYFSQEGREIVGEVTHRSIMSGKDVYASHVSNNQKITDLAPFYDVAGYSDYEMLINDIKSGKVKPKSGIGCSNKETFYWGRAIAPICLFGLFVTFAFALGG